MTRKLKQLEVSLDLDPELRDAILMTGVRLSDGSFKTIEELVSIADKALDQANEALLHNHLTKRAAQAEMKRRGKRGTPAFKVSPGARVSLVVHYESPEEDAPPTAFERKKSELPSLDALRKEAQEKGVDISDLGRQKHLIIERLGSPLGTYSSQ